MANGKFGTPTGTGTVGTDANPYIIEDGYDLAAIKNDLSAYYKLSKSVDLTKICNESDGTGWTPIEGFNGVLDGSGFMIKNLFINRVADNQALFSTTRGATIMNIGLIDANVTGGTNNTSLFVGNMTSYDDVLKNCFSTGVVTSDSNVSGLVGTLNGGTIRNCYSLASVVCTNTSSSNGAGLVSIMALSQSSIIKSYYNGKITGATNFQPYVATNTAGGSINDCHYNSDNVALATKASGALSQSDMQNPDNFKSWTDEYYNYDKAVWVLRNGSVPQLFYTEATKYFISIVKDTKTVFLTFKDNTWTTLMNDDGSAVTFPTAEQFTQHGITDNELSAISRFKWNELRQYNEFELIASTDKYIIDRQIETKKMELTQELTDALVLSTTIDFSKYGDSINQIKITQ